ncbi:hypothetical protein ACS0TY_009709 [Phlomoides rotata]
MTMKENENAASFDFESFTDKNVMECDLPELEVCYKDIDCQILKDICVDEGRPERDINVIVNFKDEKPGLLSPELPNDKVHFEAAEDSSQECTDDLSANQCRSKEKNDEGNLVSEGKLDSSLDDSLEKDSAKHCDPENSAQIGEANCEANGKVAETDSSDFSERNNVTQPPDQILNEETDSEIPDASSAEVEGKVEDVKASSLVYNSKVESRIITFNFDSPGPVASVDENSSESADAAITENVEEQLVNIEDGNSDGGSVQHVGSEDSSGETAHEQSLETKDATNHDDDDPVLISSNESGNPTNNVQAVEPKVQQHEGNNSSGHASVVNQLHRDEGEMSFSAASGLITYSGPIAFSGSLSHRSDGSTTSTKSFAFPVYNTLSLSHLFHFSCLVNDDLMAYSFPCSDYNRNGIAVQ